MQQLSSCPKCGTPVRSEQAFCQYCGTQLGTICPFCKNTLSYGIRICPTCGASANIGAPQQSGWNTQQQGWYPQQQYWNPQQSGWQTQKSSWWQYIGLPASIGIGKPSSLYLLFIVLAVLVIGLVSFIFIQFGTPEANNTPPVISGIAVTFRGKTSAQIIWQTSEPCSSQVEYGRNSYYGFLQPPIPSNDPSTGQFVGETSHFVTLNNLNPGSTYHYRVRSKDAGGIETISSDYSFKTDQADQFMLGE